MTMIECPRCGENISDQEKACPHCGFNVGVARLGRYLEERSKEHPMKYKLLKYLLIICILGVAFWLLTWRNW